MHWHWVRIDSVTAIITLPRCTDTTNKRLLSIDPLETRHGTRCTAKESEPDLELLSSKFYHTAFPTGYCGRFFTNAGSRGPHGPETSQCNIILRGFAVFSEEGPNVGL